MHCTTSSYNFISVLRCLNPVKGYIPSDSADCASSISISGWSCCCCCWYSGWPNPDKTNCPHTEPNQYTCMQWQSHMLASTAKQGPHEYSRASSYMHINDCMILCTLWPRYKWDRSMDCHERLKMLISKANNSNIVTTMDTEAIEQWGNRTIEYTVKWCKWYRLVAMKCFYGGWCCRYHMHHKS